MFRRNQGLSLGDFLDASRCMSRSAFLRKYSDPLVVAMGVLDTEEIRARYGATTELCVSKPATHNPRMTHPLAGRVFVVPVSSRPTGTLVFGRDASTDVFVPEETVSIKHCEIAWDGTEVTITDLGSTNGTLVNLRPLRPHRPVELLNEDIVTVGRHSFQYYLPQHFFKILEVLGSPTKMPDGL